MMRRILMMTLAASLLCGCYYSKATQAKAKNQTAELVFIVYHRARLQNAQFTPPGGHNLASAQDLAPSRTGIPTAPFSRSVIRKHIETIFLTDADMERRETAAEMIAREFPDRIAALRPQCDEPTKLLLDAAKKQWVK
jgi:hypothetical protein